MTRGLSVEFGVLCAPLGEQLANQGYGVRDQEELARIEMIARAVSVVTIHGLMPRSQSDRARQKLTKRLCAIVTPRRHLEAPQVVQPIRDEQNPSNTSEGGGA